MDENMILLFQKPYNFEGKEHLSIDLSGMEDLTGDDMTRIDRLYNRNRGTQDLGPAMMVPEVDRTYAMIVAAEVTRLPIEFFKGMPARETVRLRTMVSAYFFGSDSVQETDETSEN